MASENGLRVHYAQCDESELMSFHVLFKVGQDSETPDEFEFCHLLEHLQAQLTSLRYPNAQDNIARLEGLGVSSNAYCSNTQTCYHSTFVAEHVDTVVDMYVNMLLHFRPDHSVLEQEVNSVLRELEENFVNDIYHEADQEINELVYKNHRRAHGPLASIANVGDFHKDKGKQDRLKAFRARHYAPQNCCIVIAGPRSAKRKTLGLLAPLAQWSNLDGGSQTSPWKYTAPPPMAMHVHNSKLQVDSVRVEFHWLLRVVYQGNGELRSKCSLLYRLLAGGLGGRLIRKLRSELGIVYAVHVTYYMDKVNPDLSSFGIELTCSHKDVRTVVPELLKTMAKPVSEAEWRRLETLVKSSYEGSRVPKHPEIVAENLTTPFLWEDKIETVRSRYERQLDLIRRRVPMIKLGKPTYIFAVSNNKKLRVPNAV